MSCASSTTVSKAAGFYKILLLLISSCWVGIRSSQDSSRVVMVISEGVDTFVALVIEATIYIRNIWVHARIVRHQATIPTSLRLSIAVPYRGHFRSRCAHHSCGASPEAVLVFEHRLFLVALLSSEPEEDTDGYSDNHCAKNTNRNTNCSTSGQTLLTCAHIR